jgi:hypothetical protein
MAYSLEPCRICSATGALASYGLLRVNGHDSRRADGKRAGESSEDEKLFHGDVLGDQQPLPLQATACCG